MAKAETPVHGGAQCENKINGRRTRPRSLWLTGEGAEGGESFTDTSGGMGTEPAPCGCPRPEHRGCLSISRHPGRSGAATTGSARKGPGSGWSGHVRPTGTEREDPATAFPAEGVGLGALGTGTQGSPPVPATAGPRISDGTRAPPARLAPASWREGPAHWCQLEYACLQLLQTGSVRVSDRGQRGQATAGTCTR